ncbi:hypothetical protein NIES2111_60840 (plasmid) [Nostoc sp. NIES-2111]|nr:hypothetical protein NIES2111_60840 [Nostoc sp. NIES-2111]
MKIPTLRFFLRKIEPSMITGKEKLIVEEAIKKKSQVKDSILDIKKEIITIYTPDQNIGLLSELINFTSADKLKEAQAVLKRSISYSPMLRFILIDEHQRIFITQRYCFLGRIDDWINIGDSNNLQALVKKYVKHLGQESFFELH